MPAIPPGSLVLVSGASGFVAAHLCQLLLTSGYKVRGTVRDESKGEYLAKLFKSDDFSYCIVKDISEPGSFDEAVKGVVGIAHTASPFYVTATDPDELIKPALEGTKGILISAKAHCSELKRVVVTSSIAAIIDTNKHATPFNYTEADWNESSIKTVEKEGKNAPGGEMYRASKTLAERAAWDFVKNESPAWDLATINPPMIFGPIIHEVSEISKVNTSVAAFIPFVTGKKTDADLTTSTGNWVDVRDVAMGHFLALTKEEAGGNRFIVSSGPFCGQDFVDVIHAFPGDPVANTPVGIPGAGPEYDAKANVYVGTKVSEMLGLKYHTLDECIKDMYDSLKERFDL